MGQSFLPSLSGLEPHEENTPLYSQLTDLPQKFLGSYKIQNFKDPSIPHHEFELKIALLEELKEIRQEIPSTHGTLDLTEKLKTETSCPRQTQAY